MQIFVKTSMARRAARALLAVSISWFSNGGRLCGGMQIFVKICWQKPSFLPFLYSSCQTVVVSVAACKSLSRLHGKSPPCRFYILVFERWSSPWRHANFRQDFAGKNPSCCRLYIRVEWCSSQKVGSDVVRFIWPLQGVFATTGWSGGQNNALRLPRGVLSRQYI